MNYKLIVPMIVALGTLLSGFSAVSFELPKCASKFTNVYEIKYRDQPFDQLLKIYFDQSNQKFYMWKEEGANGAREIDLKTNSIQLLTYATYWSGPTVIASASCEVNPSGCLDLIAGGVLSTLQKGRRSMTWPKPNAPDRQDAQEMIACSLKFVQDYGKAIREKNITQNLNVIQSSNDLPQADH